VIHIPSPSASERKLILQYYLKKYDRNGLLASTAMSEQLEGKLYEGMSGAEIENICKVAVVDNFVI
jgi:SpoVK/Ycf46/Vps4 family AAA+-type ATPase